MINLSVTPGDRVCWTCVEAKKLSKCGSCQKVYYCSQDCQKADWPSHKFTCTGSKLRMELNPKFQVFKTNTSGKTLHEKITHARVIILIDNSQKPELQAYTDLILANWKDGDFFLTQGRNPQSSKIDIHPIFSKLSTQVSDATASFTDGINQDQRNNRYFRFCCIASELPKYFYPVLAGNSIELKELDQFAEMLSIDDWETKKLSERPLKLLIELAEKAQKNLSDIEILMTGTLEDFSKNYQSLKTQLLNKKYKRYWVLASPIYCCYTTLSRMKEVSSFYLFFRQTNTSFITLELRKSPFPGRQEIEGRLNHPMLLAEDTEKQETKYKESIEKQLELHLKNHDSFLKTQSHKLLSSHMWCKELGKNLKAPIRNHMDLQIKCVNAKAILAVILKMAYENHSELQN